MAASDAPSKSPPVPGKIDDGQYFDRLVNEQGDFNPFAERGWMTLRERFHSALDLYKAPTNPRMLEIGCGTGQSLQIYEGLIGAHTGIDLSSAAVHAASIRFPNSTWMQADACKLPFEPQSFDVVSFSSVLHHIPDYAQALSEAWRVLRPGGVIFAFDPNLFHPAMLLFRWPASPFYLSAGVSPNERPLRAVDLRRAATAAGFEDIRTRAQSNIPYREVAPRFINAMLWLYNMGDRLLDLSGLGKWFGTFVITTAQKPPGKR